MGWEARIPPTSPFKHVLYPGVPGYTPGPVEQWTKACPPRAPPPTGQKRWLLLIFLLMLVVLSCVLWHIHVGYSLTVTMECAYYAIAPDEIHYIFRRLLRAVTTNKQQLCMSDAKNFAHFPPLRIYAYTFLFALYM